MKTQDFAKPTSEKPPFLNTWPNVYALVIGALILTILFFIFITNYFK